MEQNRRCGWKASAVNDRELIKLLVVDALQNDERMHIGSANRYLYFRDAPFAPAQSEASWHRVAAARLRCSPSPAALRSCCRHAARDRLRRIASIGRRQPDGFVAEPADHRVGVRGDARECGSDRRGFAAGEGPCRRIALSADPDRFVEEKDLRLADGHDRERQAHCMPCRIGSQGHVQVAAQLGEFRDIVDAVLDLRGHETQSSPHSRTFSNPVASAFMPRLLSNIGDTRPTTSTVPLVGG